VSARRFLAAKWLPPVALAGALLLATWPAWRVWMLGDQPTLEELMQMVCSSPAKPP
jgi:hypothetical protein